MYLKTVILLIKMYSEFLYANVAIFYMHHGVNKTTVFVYNMHGTNTFLNAKAG